MKKFSFVLILLKAKSPTDFWAQNSLRFGCRAWRSGWGELDYSLLAAGLGFEELPEGFLWEGGKVLVTVPQYINFLVLSVFKISMLASSV